MGKTPFVPKPRPVYSPNMNDKAYLEQAIAYMGEPYRLAFMTSYNIYGIQGVVDFFEGKSLKLVERKDKLEEE